MPRKSSKSQKKTPQIVKRAKKHTLTGSSPNVASRDSVCQDVLLFMSHLEEDLRKFVEGELLLGQGLTENQHGFSTKTGQTSAAFEKPTTTATTSDKPTLDWKTREEEATADDRVVLRRAKDSREENCSGDDQNGGTEKAADQISQHRREKAVDNVVGSAVLIAREKVESPHVSSSNLDQSMLPVRSNKEGDRRYTSIEACEVKLERENNLSTNTSTKGQSIGPNAEAPHTEGGRNGSELGRSKRERRPSARCTTCISCNPSVPARRRHKSAPVRNLTSSPKTGASLHKGLASREEGFVTTNMIGGDNQGSFFCRDCLREFASFSGLSLHAFGNCQEGGAVVTGKDNKVFTPRIIFTDEVTVL